MGMTFRCPFSQHVIGISFTEEEKVAQLCLTLCDPMDCNLPGSSVLEILQARILEWVAIFFSRESSQPRDQTQVSGLAPAAVSQRWAILTVSVLGFLAKIKWWLRRKAPVYNVGDLGSIPGSERFPGRRKWQPTPVFLPRKSHGQRSLVHGVAKSKELDTHYQFIEFLRQISELHIKYSRYSKNLGGSPQNQYFYPAL